MKNPLLHSIPLIFILFSCEPEQKQQTIYQTIYELDSVTTKNYRLDSLTSYRSNYIDIYRENNTEYLVLESKEKSAIQLYNIEQDSLANEIILNKEGPDGVGKIRGFYIKSLDSIFVLSPFHYSIYLVNSLGEVSKQYSWVTSKSQIKSSSMAGIYTTSPAISYQGSLNLFAVPETGYTNETTFSEGNVNLRLDLNSGKINLNYHYPELYIQNMYGNLFIKIDRTKSPQNTIIYSFGADNNIYETDYKDINKSFFAGSRYFDKALVLEDFNKADEHQVMSGYYSGIKYDRFRKLYYRMAVHPTELKNISGHLNHYEDKRMSMIIMDEQFKILGETLLPKNKHLYQTWFVGEKGIYISNHNRNNKLMNENTLSFTIYEPKKI